jgi:hypothetical protein
MPSPHESALTSVRGLLGFVAALGITNTLQQFLRTNPDPILHLTSVTTQMAKPIVPAIAGAAQHCFEIIAVSPETRVCMDLGLPRYAPFILGILQIIIALRFFLASTIALENYSNNDTSIDYSWFALDSILEGILIAASSFYVHYPVDFVYLLTVLFLLNGMFTFFSSLTEPLQKWGAWNIALGVWLFALLPVYLSIPFFWIYIAIIVPLMIIQVCIRVYRQVWVRMGSIYLTIILMILLLAALVICVHNNVIANWGFFWLVVVGIAVNTVWLARKRWPDYFPERTS